MRILNDFERVLQVIESCETHAQLNTAKRMLANFFEIYRNEFDSVTQAHTMQRVQKTMDDVLLRIIK